MESKFGVTIDEIEVTGANIVTRAEKKGIQAAEDSNIMLTEGAEKEIYEDDITKGSPYIEVIKCGPDAETAGIVSGCRVLIPQDAMVSAMHLPVDDDKYFYVVHNAYVVAAFVKPKLAEVLND